MTDRKKPKKNLHTALEAIPELNYVAGVPLSTLSIDKKSISPPVGMGISLGWNYIDGICAIALGVDQLLDQKHYCQTHNKIKGLINILSGVQVFALSYNPVFSAAFGLASATSLASPAFAISVLCDLVTAAIDFCKADKQVKFDGWLDERESEYAFIEKRIEKFTKEKIALENRAKYLGDLVLLDNDKHEKNKRRISQLEIELKTLAARKNMLYEDILIRSTVRIYQINSEIIDKNKTYGNEEQGYNKPASGLLDYDLKERMKQLKEEKERVEEKMSSWINKMPDSTSPEIQLRFKNIKKIEGSDKMDIDNFIEGSDKKRDKEIQESLNQARKNAAHNLALRTMSFVGMALIATSTFVVCPPALIAGIVITAIVAAAYLAKNSHKIYHALRNFGIFCGVRCAHDDQPDPNLQPAPP